MKAIRFQVKKGDRVVGLIWLDAGKFRFRTRDKRLAGMLERFTRGFPQMMSMSTSEDEIVDGFYYVPWREFLADHGDDVSDLPKYADAFLPVWGGYTCEKAA